MLTMTENAIDAVKRVAPGEAGLRLYTTTLPTESAQESLHVEVVDEPGAEDHVLDAEGAHVFLEPRAATLLDDKVLDATFDGPSVRFAIGDRR
jgi:iron-sulfur cluster assembly protein